MFNYIYKHFSKKYIIFFVIFLLSSCASEKVNKNDDLCKVYNKNYHWYRSAYHSQKKHNIDATIIMSVMAQESNFTHNARPGKKYVLNFIPWGHETSAKGYGQVIDGAWDDYRKESKKWFQSRQNFDDVTDYIGWYLNKASYKLKINRNDSYHLYLAYHQGMTGYKRHDEKNDQKLNLIAKKVQRNSNRYQKEFKQCQNALWLKHWIYVWDY